MKNPIQRRREKKEREIQEKIERDRKWWELMQRGRQLKMEAKRAIREFERDYQIQPIIERLDRIISLLEEPEQ